jgi:hypothetical protein
VRGKAWNGECQVAGWEVAKEGVQHKIHEVVAFPVGICLKGIRFISTGFPALRSEPPSLTHFVILLCVDRKKEKEGDKMTTKQPEPVIETEKNARLYDEKAELESVKPAAGGHVDYTGSVAKTDPREIALVRKVDWRLMVSTDESLIRDVNLNMELTVERSRRCVPCTFS